MGLHRGRVIGVIIGCATFAVSASRVNAVKFSFDGSEYRSSLDREPEELAILTAHGHEIQGMSLQSYLFFGSANGLYQNVKAQPSFTHISGQGDGRTAGLREQYHRRAPALNHPPLLTLMDTHIDLALSQVSP
jgi:hypothetical protein